LHKPEEALKRVLLPLVPRWLETNHLTLMTLPWCGFILLFSYFARFNIAWLWGVSAMIAAQYVTDLLDGAIGRQRNTGLVKWGFYMDHFLDFVFLCSLLIGYAILLPQIHRTALFFVMALFAGFMVNSFLSFGATNKFQIAYMGMGPTEMRIVFILVNTLLVFFGTGWLVKALPWTLAGAAFGLFFTVYRTQHELWRVDMAAKHGHAAMPAVPPSRHRLSFAAALVLGVAGIWLATLPTLETAVRLGSLTLLAVATGLFVISLREFRRLGLKRRYFLASLWSHLPYLVVGIILLVGLRVWFVVMPLGVDFKPRTVEMEDVENIRNPKSEVQSPKKTYVARRNEYLALEEKYRGFINMDAVAEPNAHADAFVLFFAAYVNRCAQDVAMAKLLLGDERSWLELGVATEQERETRRLVRESTGDVAWIRLTLGAAYLKLHRENVEVCEPLLKQIDWGLGFLFDVLPSLFWRTMFWGF